MFSCIAMNQNASRLPWVAFEPGRFAEKNASDASFQYCERSVAMPFLMSSKTCSGTPSGLPGPWIISGGMADSRTARETRPVPWRPM